MSSLKIDTLQKLLDKIEENDEIGAIGPRIINTEMELFNILVTIFSYTIKFFI